MDSIAHYTMVKGVSDSAKTLEQGAFHSAIPLEHSRRLAAPLNLFKLTVGTYRFDLLNIPTTVVAVRMASFEGGVQPVHL